MGKTQDSFSRRCKMRKATREDLEQIYDSENITESFLIEHRILDEFECSECGSDIYIHQGPDAFDATIGCVNCDRENVELN